MVTHLAYAGVLLYYTTAHPGDRPLERVVRTLALLTSVFLACTVWTYGRTFMFLCVHNLWQLTVVFSALYALKPQNDGKK